MEEVFFVAAAVVLSRQSKELETILGTLPNKFLLAGEVEARLSLAGAQNKLAKSITSGSGNYLRRFFL
ncbi:hypothetical protein PDESU_05064 [Pontiella desulfatans]|uniref:Uncharacterized protein n=1 Tax=Pontiella desulfatans TaxID=2750659 RepID=A0A6C2U9E0_PONDE|nr:type II toxin-antitoxin system HipA family toxin [Pontiella desulfatans]VGO16473.1 hypothetical protein PDESU_05064 [Pontiella desulfatans]